MFPEASPCCSHHEWTGHRRQAGLTDTAVLQARQQRAEDHDDMLNPLLAPELAVPLIDVQSALREGYSAQYRASHSTSH